MSDATTTPTVQEVAQNTYYEHFLCRQEAPYNANSVEEIWSDLSEKYHLLVGYTTFSYGNTGVLVLRSMSDLSTDIIQILTEELKPEQSVYNIKHKQSLGDFLNWEYTQSQEEMLNYWQTKMTNIAEISAHQQDAHEFKVFITVPAPNDLDEAFKHVASAREHLDNVMTEPGFYNPFWRDAYEQIFDLLLGLKSATSHTAAALGLIYIKAIDDLDDQLKQEWQSKIKICCPDSHDKWSVELFQAQEIFHQILVDDVTYVLS